MSPSRSEATEIKTNEALTSTPLRKRNFNSKTDEESRWGPWWYFKKPKNYLFDLFLRSSSKQALDVKSKGTVNDRHFVILSEFTTVNHRIIILLFFAIERISHRCRNKCNTFLFLHINLARCVFTRYPCYCKIWRYHNLYLCAQWTQDFAMKQFHQYYNQNIGNDKLTRSRLKFFSLPKFGWEITKEHSLIPDAPGTRSTISCTRFIV